MVYLSNWQSGVVVSALASINKVNQHWARLVLRWVTVSGFNSRCLTFILVLTNQPLKANSAVHPSGVGKWVPASAGKAKAGMVHSVGGWMRGVQVKLWDPLRMRAIPECLRGVFTTRRYTNTRLPYLYLSRLSTMPCMLEATCVQMMLQLTVQCCKYHVFCGLLSDCCICQVRDINC